MKLTKQLINRFNNSEIEVRVMNGTHKEATATVTYSGGRKHRVEVNRAHPLLKSLCCVKEYSKFIFAETSSSGTIHEVPEELKWVEQELYKIAETSDEEAREMLKDIQGAMGKFYKEMGIN